MWQRIHGKYWRNHTLIRWSLASALVLAGVVVHLSTEDPQLGRATVAARELPAGAVLQPDDLIEGPAVLGLPAVSATDIAGKVLRTALQRGEPVLAGNLDDPGPAAGKSAFPLMLPPGAAVVPPAVGDLVSIYVTANNEARLAVQDVRVLDVSASDSSQTASARLEVTPDQALQLAQIDEGMRISLTVGS